MPDSRQDGGKDGQKVQPEPRCEALRPLHVRDRNAAGNEWDLGVAGAGFEAGNAESHRGAVQSMPRLCIWFRIVAET